MVKLTPMGRWILKIICIQQATGKVKTVQRTSNQGSVVLFSSTWIILIYRKAKLARKINLLLRKERDSSVGCPSVKVIIITLVPEL